MFGTLRFFLALLVAYSHFTQPFHGIEVGQFAVIAFYILSGFLMQGQVQKLQFAIRNSQFAIRNSQFAIRNSQFAIRNSLVFYIDRFLRIYPLYILVILAAMFLDQKSLADIIQNFLIFPINYTTFTGAESFLAPTWSLACELHFYLLAPFLVSQRLSALKYTAYASLFVFCAAPLYARHVDFWSYKGLPGILFVFIMGMMLRQGHKQWLKYIQMFLIFVLCLFVFIKVINTHAPVGININVLLGCLLSYPVIKFLAKLSPKANFDKFLGSLSYPVFLCHMPIAKLLEYHFGVNSLILLLGASVACGWILSIAVEKPFDALRYRIRSKFLSSKAAQH